MFKGGGVCMGEVDDVAALIGAADIAGRMGMAPAGKPVITVDPTGTNPYCAPVAAANSCGLAASCCN